MSNKKQELEQSKIHKTIQRNKIVALSSKELSEKGINIKEEVLNVLKEEGFNIEESGTRYLASLIALLFHERKLYQRLHDRQSYQNYWNLNDEKNEHYHMLGDNSRQVIKAMKESLKTSKRDSEMISSLIFRITDEIVKNYDKDKEMIGYIKILKK